MTNKGLKKEVINVKHYAEVFFMHHGGVVCEVEKRERGNIPGKKLFFENGVRFGDTMQSYRYYDVVTSKNSNGEIVQTKENFSKVFIEQGPAAEFARSIQQRLSKPATEKQ